MQNEDVKQLERVPAKQAAKELNIDIETLHYQMQKERLPIGYAIKRDKAKRHSYVIYRGLLDAYKQTIARQTAEHL